MRTTDSAITPAGRNGAPVLPGTGARPSRPARGSMPRRPTGLGIAVASLACFLAILAVLSWRMAAGRDPALGDADPAALTTAAADQRRPVIHRRVVKLRVVHDPPATPGTAAAEPAAATPVTSTAASAAPSPSSAAPAVQAPSPAPTPAPAPAPAPAPPVTQSS